MAFAVTTGSANDSSLTLALRSSTRPEGSKVALPNATDAPASARRPSIACRRKRGTWSSFTVAM